MYSTCVDVYICVPGYCKSNEVKSCDELFAENRMEGLGPVVQHRIIAGTYFLTYR